MIIDCTVLGIHPFTRGFGWVLFQKPFVPLDWGVVEKKKEKHAQCVFAFERIIDRYEPTVLALEKYDSPPTQRVARIRRLSRSFVSLAEGRSIETCIYSRFDVRSVFAVAGAASRYEIAHVIAQRVDALRPRLPKKRPLWESEKPNMALFNAAAVALTHYQLADESMRPGP
jgi:Holliday junction resolvasome RuvABC endonuclease subunit